MAKLITILSLFFCVQLQGQMGGTAAYYTASFAPKWGVLVNSETLSNTEKARIAKDTLGCTWARTAIVASQWDGSSNRFEIYDGMGLLQTVNIAYYPNSSGQNFPTGTILTNFIDTSELILDTYPQIGLVTLLNEELNQSYHSGAITDYCLMMVQMYAICHARGIPLTDGGVAGTPLEISTYRYVKSTYGQTEADQFGAACMTNAQVNAANNPGSNPTLEAAVRLMDTLLMYSAYLDYWNIHTYEVLSETNTQPDTVTQVSLNVLRYEKEFLTANSGKPVITTETGIRNNDNPVLVTNMLTNFARIGMPFVFYFNGYDAVANTSPLTDETTGDILPSGEAFRDYIIATQSKNWPPN